MMVVISQAQDYVSESRRMVPLQKKSQAVNQAMPLSAKDAISPAANQMWWGYFSETDVQSSYSSIGNRNAGTVDAFIYIPAGTEMVSNSMIRAMRLWFSDGIFQVTSMKIWISRTAPGDNFAPLYSQDLDVSSLTTKANDIMLNTPFEFHGDGIYVGYTASFPASTFFIMSGGSDEANTFFYRFNSDKVNDFNGYGYGKMGLQLLIEGGTYPTSRVAVDDFGQSMVLKGQTVNVPITITNKGQDVVENISYTISTNGAITTPETTITVNSLNYNGHARIYVPFVSDSDSRKNDKTLTITKVNGAPNTCSNNSATGTLITVTESPASLPVVEEYTGTWCGYCPYGTVGMKKAHDIFGDRVALIAVHSDDVMAISAYSPVVSKFADGFPSSFINREGSSIYPYYLTDYLSGAITRTTVGTIELTASWSDDSQTSVRFDTKTKFAYSDNNSNYGIAFVLVEDGLKGSGSSWEQVNYLSGSSGESDMSFWFNSGSRVSGLEYDHVAVAGWDLLDGISGSVSSSFSADEVLEFSYTGDLAQFNLIQDKSKLTAIALLINKENGTIVNAAQVKVGNSVSGKPLKGDVNEDGKVDVADIAIIIDIMAGKE